MSEVIRNQDGTPVGELKSIAIKRSCHVIIPGFEDVKLLRIETEPYPETDALTPGLARVLLGFATKDGLGIEIAGSISSVFDPKVEGTKAGGLLDACEYQNAQMLQDLEARKQKE